MAIENVYSYLEYLTLTVDQLADAVAAREEESATAEFRIRDMGNALIQAQKEIDKADARAQLAEAQLQKAQMKIDELSIQLKSAKQPRKAKDPQIDMFAAPYEQPVETSQPAIVLKSNKVANDENALILARRLDSTIDKVQKLIREARA